MDRAVQPDETFIEQIRDALAHLYAYSYLQAHPLIDQFAPPTELSPQGRMRFLRSLLLEAIEEMNPGRSVPFRSYRARGYNVLNLHYVEGLMIQEVAAELAISERQVYRDLRKAEQDLAVLLWPRRRSTRAPEPAQTRSEAVLLEVERLRGTKEELALRPLLEGALRSVARLAEERNVCLSLTLPAQPLSVPLNRMIARQALVGALSYAIRHATPQGGVTLSVEGRGGEAHLIVSYTHSVDSPDDSGMTLTTCQQLVELQGGQWRSEVNSDEPSTIAFTLGAGSQATLLVIDDNEGLIELFQRYLTGEGYRLIGARNGIEGQQLAEEHAPDTIVLDVMMPGQDGWEVLQLLRNRRSTRHIPVIVCSVIDDPELALSLGANEFLSKPVKREELLTALARCQRRHTAARSYLTAPEDSR